MVKIYVIENDNRSSHSKNINEKTKKSISHINHIGQLSKIWKGKIFLKEQKDKAPFSLKSHCRTQVFLDILNNKQSDRISWKYMLYDLVGLIGAILSTSIYTVIPHHNVIVNPRYWYELLLQVQFNVLPLWSSNIILRCDSWMDIASVKTFKNFFILWLSGSVNISLLFSVYYITWSLFFNYQWPIPFLGILLAYPTIFVLYVTLWFRFPKPWRLNTKFKGRLKSFMLATGYYQCLMLQYMFIKKSLLMVPPEYQWCVSIILPFTREVNSRITSKLAKKACNSDERRVEIVCNHNVSLEHAKFVTYFIGTVATTSTSACILVMDYLINLRLCLKLIWGRNRGFLDAEKCIKLLQDLAINEMIEFVTPLAYLACLVIAFYGPNSELIGGVKSNYWQYSSLESISHTITFISVFFLVDFTSVLISRYLLWRFCKISLWSACLALQKEFGFLFALRLINDVTMVRKLNISLDMLEPIEESLVTIFKIV